MDVVPTALVAITRYLQNLSLFDLKVLCSFNLDELFFPLFFVVVVQEQWVE